MNDGYMGPNAHPAPVKVADQSERRGGRGVCLWKVEPRAFTIVTDAAQGTAKNVFKVKAAAPETWGLKNGSVIGATLAFQVGMVSGRWVA